MDIITARILIRPEFWNRGYATEALRATLDFIFQATPAERAKAYCDVANVASARVMAKAGMSRVITPPDPENTDGVTEYHFALSREQWMQDHAL